MADTNRPPNYTLMYFKLSYVCPKTWRFRKDELETVTLQTLKTYFYIFLGPTYFRLFFHVLYFLMGLPNGGGD